MRVCTIEPEREGRLMEGKQPMKASEGVMEVHILDSSTSKIKSFVEQLQMSVRKGTLFSRLQ